MTKIKQVNKFTVEILSGKELICLNLKGNNINIFPVKKKQNFIKKIIGLIKK